MKMAIGRTVRPLLLVDGTVERTAPLRNKAQEVYAHEITLSQDNGAQVAFRVYNDDSGRPAMTTFPSIGDYLAAEVSVSESRDWGATLAFERPAFDRLDQIGSNLAALSNKKAA